MVKEIKVFTEHSRVHKEEGKNCGNGGGGGVALRGPLGSWKECRSGGNKGCEYKR